MRRRPLCSVAFVALLALVASGCGQKAGVHQVGAAAPPGGGLGAPGAAVDPVTGQSVDGALEPGAAPAPSDGAAPPAGGAPPAPADGAAAAPPAAGGTGAPAPAAGPAAPSGPVWGDEIVIGVHAPITGAAPLPASFAEAAKVYAAFVNGKGGINGRKLRVIVVDDEFTPSVAQSRCTELIDRDKAFLLIGGGGADQIQTCARVAAQKGVPYLSAGVTEVGLRQLKNYFALSMSYVQQGPYLANYIKRTFPDRAGKAAMVFSNTPNIQDGRASFIRAYGAAKEYPLARAPSTSELADAARRMCSDGIRVAFPLMTPTAWLQLANNTKAIPGCDIQWAGVGLTMGLNTVANTGCKANQSVNGAVFFSPFPGTDRATQLDPEFAGAPGAKPADDIHVALWSVTKATGELLRRAGPQLTRAGFVQTAEQTRDLATGMNPVLNYSPDDHFGARQVHVLKAECSGGNGVYKTVATFATF